jgi:hypothetical protein
MVTNQQQSWSRFYYYLPHCLEYYTNNLLILKKNNSIHQVPTLEYQKKKSFEREKGGFKKRATKLSRSKGKRIWKPKKYN